MIGFGATPSLGSSGSGPSENLSGREGNAEDNKNNDGKDNNTEVVQPEELGKENHFDNDQESDEEEHDQEQQQE